MSFPGLVLYLAITSAIKKREMLFLTISFWAFFLPPKNICADTHGSVGCAWRDQVQRSPCRKAVFVLGLEHPFRDGYRLEYMSSLLVFRIRYLPIRWWVVSLVEDDSSSGRSSATRIEDISGRTITHEKGSSAQLPAESNKIQSSAKVFRYLWTCLVPSGPIPICLGLNLMI